MKENLFNAEEYFGEQEKALAKLDLGWAKASLFFNSGCREHFDHKLGSRRARSLIKIHNELEVRRKRFESGETLELLHAINLCAQENLPLPTWLASAFHEKFNDFLQPGGATSLDEVFHSKGLPLTQTRARQARRDWQIGAEIWREVWKVWEQHSSLESALKAVLRDGNFGVELTKARELMLMVDRNQFELLGKPEQALERQFERKKKR